MNKSGASISYPARTVTCPTCHGESIYAHTNPHRPFCSERCSNIDLGNWANEDFRVQVESDVEFDQVGREPEI